MRAVRSGYLAIARMVGGMVRSIGVQRWEVPPEQRRDGYALFLLVIATLVAVGLLAGAALVAGMSVDANVLSWSSLPANLLMVHAWGLAPAAGWNHPSWSISATISTSRASIALR